MGGRLDSAPDCAAAQYELRPTYSDCWGLTCLWHVSGLQGTTAERIYILRWAKNSEFSLWHSILVCCGPCFTRTLNGIRYFFLERSVDRVWKLSSTCQNRALLKTSKVGTHEQICLCGLDLGSQVVIGTVINSLATQPAWNSELMYPCSFWS